MNALKITAITLSTMALIFCSLVSFKFFANGQYAFGMVNGMLALCNGVCLIMNIKN